MQQLIQHGVSTGGLPVPRLTHVENENARRDVGQGLWQNPDEKLIVVYEGVTVWKFQPQNVIYSTPLTQSGILRDIYGAYTFKTSI